MSEEGKSLEPTLLLGVRQPTDFLLSLKNNGSHVLLVYYYLFYYFFRLDTSCYQKFFFYGFYSGSEVLLAIILKAMKKVQVKVETHFWPFSAWFLS